MKFNKKLLIVISIYKSIQYYFQRINDKLVVPSYVLSSSLSRSLLLFAIEAFDDALVGSTNYSMKISEETDEMFANITNV